MVVPIDLGMLWIMVKERPLLVLQAVTLGILFMGVIYLVCECLARFSSKFLSQHAETILWVAVVGFTLLICAIYSFIGVEFGAGYFRG